MSIVATLDRGSIRGRDDQSYACIGRKGGNVLLVRMTQPEKKKKLQYSQQTQLREALDLPMCELHRQKTECIAWVCLWLTDEANKQK